MRDSGQIGRVRQFGALSFAGDERAAKRGFILPEDGARLRKVD